VRPPVPLCFVLLLLFAFKKRPDLAPSSQGEGATYTALFIRNDLAHNFVNFLYQTLVFRFMKFRLPEQGDLQKQRSVQPSGW
jgi:hypothetical protein